MNNSDILKEPIMYIVVTEITRKDGSKFFSSRPMGFDNESFDGVDEGTELDNILDGRVIAVIPAPPGMFKVYKADKSTNMFKLIGYEHPNAENPDWTKFEENRKAELKAAIDFCTKK